ncbi:TetR family transcriptional regulator [Streptomyces sp. NPDC007157]|uniref:TetR/AcrR family transcriptional regulator n=1 Tax=Streptomyces sp. NPDC007157 TaxID=3154681 RepID=UPI0033E77266
MNEQGMRAESVDVESGPEEGRRARKKAATRQALQQAAARMFAEHGYQETAVKDIAAAAGVTERTFFRYFPSKEDLIFAEILDLVPLLKREIPLRPSAEPPLSAVLNGLLTAAAELDSGLAILFVGAPPRSLSGNAPRTHVLTSFEDGIADALETRFARQAPDEPPHRRALRASVLARAAVAAVRGALIAYSYDGTGDADHRSVDDFAALLTEAFEVLRGAA